MWLYICRAFYFGAERVKYIRKGPNLLKKEIARYTRKKGHVLNEEWNERDRLERDTTI